MEWGKTNNFMIKKPDKHYFSQMIKFISTATNHVDSIYSWYVMKMALYPWSSPKSIKPQSTHEINITKSNRGVSLQYTWLVLFKMVKDIKNKDLRKCHSWEEPKKTWQLIVTRCSGTEKGWTLGKTEGHLHKLWILVNTNVSMLVH